LRQKTWSRLPTGRRASTMMRWRPPGSGTETGATRRRAFPRTVTVRFSTWKKSLAGSISTWPFSPGRDPGDTWTATVLKLSDSAPMGAR
jgi:hypothetical protein